jgi:hypothetical protein
MSRSTPLTAARAISWDDSRSEELNRACGPYTSFTCTNNLELILVLSVIGGNADVHVKWNNEKGQLEYIVRFLSQNHLKQTIRYLETVRDKIKNQMIHGW